MKLLFTAFILFFAMNISAQELNKKYFDKSRNQEVLLNNCTRDALVAFPEFKQSYDPNYAGYTPDSAMISGLKKLARGKQITVVLGTWCGDSKLQVPRFYKVLDMAGIDTDKINLIAVDGSKHAENGIIDAYKIQHVPTFIFSNKDGKEIGRITETPKKTLEADVRDILMSTK